MRETTSGRRTRRPDGGANLYSLPVSYVAVDTETTGLDFDFCDIIEIGAVRVEDGEIADTFDSLVNIGYEVASFITELTGITDKMLEEAPSPNDVISKFEAFAGDSVLLAHNASFDMNFLYAAYEKVLGKPMKNDFELPEWSVREAITNAVVHRSYVECSSVQVALYDDRLEVSSPGGIVRGFSLNRALSGQSRPRNEALAQAFLYMGLIEGWGSGLPRVLQEFEGRGLQRPEFADIDGMLRVNLWRPANEQFATYLHGAVAVSATDGKPTTATDEQLTRQSSDNKPSDTTDRQPISTDRQPMTTDRDSQIVSYLAKQGPSGVAEVADLLGLSKDRTRAILRGLTERGLIRKLGDKRYTRYVVTGGGR